MDFALSPKHEMMKSMFREFAEKEVAPLAAELDEKSEFSWDLFRKMGQLGMFGIPYPQEYGGLRGNWPRLHFLGYAFKWSELHK